VYDIALDTSAFVTAFLTHELRADVNLDGIWDTGDISQWQTHFFEDAAQ